MNKRLLSVFAFVAFVLPSVAVLPHPALAAGWAEVDSPTSETLFSVDKYGDLMIAVGADGTAIYSEDEGKSWDEGDSNTSIDLYGTTIFTSSKAVAVGTDAMIMRTSNGGQSWSEASIDGLTSAQESYEFRAVYAVSSTVGWAVGAHGMIVKTEDGGATWEAIDSPTSQSLNQVDAVSTSIVWVVGENGVIYKSTNGGNSWSSQSSGTSEHLVCIYMYNSSIGYASGDNETILKTTNGGSDWDQIYASELQNGETVIDLSFDYSENGILTGSEGTLLRTEDGGDNWSEVDESVSEPLLDVIDSATTTWWGVGDNGTIARYDAAAPDAPTNFDVSGDNSSVSDSTPKFTWSASNDDETSIDYYEFKMDSDSYKNIGNVTTKTYSTELDNGRHTAYVRAVDDAGNTSSAASVTFTVDADSSSSPSGNPDIAKITPTSAVKNETVTFNAMIEDDDGTIDSCALYVDGDYEKAMSIKTDMAYTTMKFTATGSYSVYARCINDDGDTVSGSSTTVSVVSDSGYADPGDLIKITCSGNVYVNDPCTTVYYYGYDGRRHAFPNEAVFKSWFNDFDDLVQLTSSAMANISLGENVTYKPGEQLVQFSTSTVYAVSYGGILRPIANGTIAKSLFGSNWTSEIAWVSDVFFGNYRIGSTIESSADFSISGVQSVSKTIDSTF